MNFSLLRYPGGKTRAIPILQKYIPKNTKKICSPFFGGGSFEIYLSSIGIEVFGYDVFEPLVSFWRSLLNDRENLYNEVNKYFPLSKEDFYKMQKEIKEENNCTKIGAMFYVLNRASFSGTGMSGGMSPGHKRFTKSSIERLKTFEYRFNIEKCSFENSISKHDCLIYCDPPYLISSHLYGNRGNAHKNFNHQLLAKILNDRGNFLLSYNDHDEIKDMYKDHEIIYPNWSYGMGSNKKGNEILIISKDVFRTL